MNEIDIESTVKTGEIRAAAHERNLFSAIESIQQARLNVLFHIHRVYITHMNQQKKRD